MLRKKYDKKKRKIKINIRRQINRNRILLNYEFRRWMIFSDQTDICFGYNCVIYYVVYSIHYVLRYFFYLNLNVDS